MVRRHPLVKFLVGLTALAALGLVFAATLRDVASEAYTVRADDLQRWTVAISTPADPDAPLILLRPPRTLPMALFDQVFQRTMVSLAVPSDPGIPLVLGREFESALASTVMPDELVAVARDVGLETARLEPACMSVYRTVEGREQQRFFVLFELPEFARFRAGVTELLLSRGADASRFDPNALTPALLVASSEGALIRRAPPRADLEEDCEAPVASR